MAEMNFTPAQADAISCDGGSVIVSAAAGSGKTRVLVERVIRRLTDRTKPVDADRLLIVTFTRAAAEEMRSRISAAIEKKLVEEPENLLLRRQQLLIANADICTIHSFCSRIIRENFFALDLDRDFRIANEGETELLKNRLLSELIEEYYTKNDPAFRLLSSLLSETRTDKRLEKALLSVYESSRAHPFPDKWLMQSASFYDPSVPVEKTIYAAVAFRLLSQAAENISYQLSQAEEVITGNPAFCTGAATCAENRLTYLQSFFERLKAAEKEGSWNSLHECITSYSPPSYRKPTSKKNPASEEECSIVRGCFDGIDRAMTGSLIQIFGVSGESYRHDTEQLYPAVLCMCDMLSEFDSRYLDAKKDRGVLDFSDLEHQLLRLLVSEKDGVPEKTELAYALSAHYDEIMVDEYQDTNETQEFIFRCLSRDESNLFVVGDVKQSIYRFREAMPEIFKKRRKASVPYDRDAPAFPARIILDRNFRSRAGVIGSINYVFRTIMSEQVGELEYDSDEELTAGAVYPETDEPENELHLLTGYAPSDDDTAEDDDATACEREAMYIAGLIKQMIAEKRTVTENGRLRPVSYGDFAVLMRFISTNGQVYADILNRSGVPAYIDKPYSLFGCYEVNLALSLLKVTDNPLQDIPLLSLMLCPVFGFTPDELSELRCEYDSRLLYNRLLACISDDKPADPRLKEKCTAFMGFLSEMRRLSVTLPVSRLLDRFFVRTGFRSVICAMENGGIRIKNLKKLMSFINDYEGSGKRSLTEFVRHIGFLEENGTDISVGDTAPADSVRIMSVHHSKGLEFPVCILAGLSGKGNTFTDEVITHSDLGLGFKTIEPDTMLKFNTLQRNVISACKAQEEKSEAMRVLYVAMTRAKEKLISIISIRSVTDDGAAKKLQKLSSAIRVSDGRISPYTVENYTTLADWLLLCALVHPDMKELRELAGIKTPVLPTSSSWRLVLADNVVSTGGTDLSAGSDIQASVDTELLSLINRRFAERYAHQSRTVIPSKVSASTLVHNDMQLYHIAESRPAFMQQNNMTGAEKGTAMHLFLQHADLDKLTEQPEAEISRLLEERYITPEQAAVIKSEDIARFTGSDTYRCMVTADKRYTEYRFTVNISAGEVDESYPEDERVILQGAIDCLLINKDGIIIIDYKTDKVKTTDELVRRYSRQLKLYRQAAVELFDLPVVRCIIYSVTLAEETDV